MDAVGRPGSCRVLPLCWTGRAGADPFVTGNLIDSLRHAARTLGLAWADIPALRTVPGIGAPLLRTA
ncbi:hypothetical protein ACWDF1_35780 [Streptomyces coelicoflavus]|uniref:hypothetical protein n=1 Tax=Streptomyces coelicoflavus TaxID=285562 RepID=UPI00369CF071